MTPLEAPLRHASLHLRPDPSRVIARPFLPGQEGASAGISRAEAVVARVVALSDPQVDAALAAVVKSFGGRHPDLPGTFREHFALVAHRIPPGVEVSNQRSLLVGAYFTQEYAIEGASVFNPSIVPHPVQAGVGPGEVRFIMSLRAVGEGHLSTIEFRTGRFGPRDTITLEAPATRLHTGTVEPVAMPLTELRRALAGQGDAPAAESVLGSLPAHVHPSDLQEVLASNERDSIGWPGGDGLINRIRGLAANNYDVTFPEETMLSARVLYPSSPAEAQGLEDARFTRFEGIDGAVTYYATYTAFDGFIIAPHLIRTDDFRTFSMRQLTGTAATNKGMALFPRLVRGRHWAISRWDRENLSVAHSSDAHHWEDPVVVQRPRHPWDLVQLGTCASPIETPQGWLVITHGVGPVRTYAIGAMLLDLHDPTRVLAVLDHPLMTVDPHDRDGYVPNVVYTCGALLHDSTILLPYGCSDSTIRFACIDLSGLLDQLRLAASRTPDLEKKT